MNARHGFRLLLLSALAWAAPSGAQTQALDSLLWVSEEAPPYHYLKDGVPTGIAVDVLARMQDLLGSQQSPPDIRFLPWARARYMALHQPGTCLFAQPASDEERQGLAYVGPLLDTRIAIIVPTQRADDISGPRDLAALTVGVVRDSAAEELLAATGVPARIIRTDSPRTLVRMLAGGRFDAIAYLPQAAARSLQQEGIVTTAYRPVFTLHEGTIGYACHRDTDPALIARMRNALERLHTDGTVESIRRHYER